MKKILITTLLSTVLFGNTEINKLGNNSILEEHHFYINETMIDYCIDNQVWKRYKGNKKGSVSQLMVRNDWNKEKKLEYPSSIPLSCKDYKKWKKR